MYSKAIYFFSVYHGSPGLLPRFMQFIDKYETVLKILLARYIYIQCSCMYNACHSNIHVRVLMRDEKEGRKKQARSNKQTRKSNAAHPRQ